MGSLEFHICNLLPMAKKVLDYFLLGLRNCTFWVLVWWFAGHTERTVHIFTEQFRSGKLTIKSTCKLSRLKFTDHKKCVLRESATEEANSVP